VRAPLIQGLQCVRHRFKGYNVTPNKDEAQEIRCLEILAMVCAKASPNPLLAPVIMYKEWDMSQLRKERAFFGTYFGSFVITMAFVVVSLEYQTI
jgi:hypothetical protein